MQCLYCGKGIGPIRQLRDLEFCSEAHRNQFRERYRRQAYEALASDPAPAQMADFMERPPATGGPAPSAVLRALPKSLPGEGPPAMRVAAAGVSVERPGWVFWQTLAAMPTRPAWQDSAAAYPSTPSPIRTASFSICIQPPNRPAAGAAPTHLVAGNSAPRPAWQDSAAAYPPPPSPIRTASFSICIQPPNGSAAGAAPTHLVAGNSTAPPAAAPRISASSRSLLFPVSLPDVAQIPAPVTADPSSPQLHAAIPMYGDPAAIGPVPPAIHAAVTLPCSTTITGPTAPPGPESAPEVGLSPAVIASQPRPLEAGPLLIHCDLKTAADQGLPVAFEAPGTRNIGIILPKPPALAASSTWIAAMQHAQPVQPELRLSVAAQAAMLPAASVANCILPVLPGIQVVLPASEQLESAIQRPLALAPMAPTADPQPAGGPTASPSWHAARTDASSNPPGPLGSHAFPRVESPAAPIGALAGLVQPGSSPAQEAAGNRDPRSAVAAAPARIETLAARQELSLLPGALPQAMGSAPLPQAEAPAPAAPPAAVPSWDATRAVSQDHPLVPSLDIDLPRIDCLPAPAGAVDEVGLPWRPGVGRAVRSCAVLWTLRVAHLRNPAFRMDPVRARFNDLVRAERSMPYSRDLEDKVPAKTNLRPFKRAGAARSSQPKWLYIGAAAAALLLAGALRPQVAPKGFGESLPWRGMSIRQWVSQRATRSFADDFRSGLNQWKGLQPKWPKSWSHSPDGFIHPGQLALYRPSVPLSDYRFEFMAQVESKSVDWVVRAQDADNYYALKFTVLQPGPRPLMAMVRYPVIEGHKGARVETPLRMMIHAHTPYRVTVDVKGNRYRAYIEDQEADFWTEDSLKTGGVGFFSEAGEHARVYWVKLESHGDVLGRICGLLSGNSSERASNEGATKHGGVIARATTAGLRAGLGTIPIPSRAQRAPRQGADALLLTTFCLTRRPKQWITGMQEPRI